MPKIAKMLTEAEVRAIPVGKTRALGGVRGLYLHKATAETGYYFLRYMQKGRKHDFGLGSYLDVSLDFARKKARKVRELVVQGINPIENKDRLREEEFVVPDAGSVLMTSKKTLTEAEIRAIPAGKTRALHGVRGLCLRKGTAEKGYYFLRYKLNGRSRELSLGSYPAASLDFVMEKARKARVLVVQGIDPLENRDKLGEEESSASVAASRADGANRSDADGNRSAAEGQPLQELALRLPGECGIYAALDLPRVMQAVHSYGSMPSRALEFAVLTASSPRAVLLAEWEEFDLERGVWTVPAEHDPERAARGDLVVYLSRRARTVLDTLPDFGREEKKGLVFSDVRGVPLPQDAMERRLSEIPLKWFLQHDFRGDGDGAGVEAERRLAMEAWGEFASSLIPAWHPKEPED